MLVLGLETSCDETAVGIVNAERRILANRVASQLTEHKPYSGVVPEIAARAHLDKLDDLIHLALDDAKVALNDLAGIAATCGPGLIGGVMVGAMTGKAMAAAKHLPFIAVNHLEAHALTARLTHDVAFPYLLLLVSGGHCQLLLVKGVGDYRLLGTSIDDAVGECFDKGAKMLGLGYPGGPAVERAAADGDAHAFELPRPMLGRRGCDFSFSGLKTALRLLTEKNSLSFRGPVTRSLTSTSSSQQHQRVTGNPESHFLFGGKKPNGIPDQFASAQPAPYRSMGLPQIVRNDKVFISDAAASLQSAIADILADRTRNALEILASENIKISALVAAGGVASNGAIRARLVKLASENYGLPFVAPPPELCTDNGAMVAWAGLERLRLGYKDGLDTAARPRWPLDPNAQSRAKTSA